MATPLEVMLRFPSSTAGNGERGKPALELLPPPPLTEDEILRSEGQLPCPIPGDAREWTRYARGFTVQHPLFHGMHHRFSPVDLSALGAQVGLEQMFPHALSIADDGCGNYWVIEFTSGSRSWGRLFVACHDPAVIV